MNPVEKMLRVLCLHYAKDGQPHEMNDVQVKIYAEELAAFYDADLQDAARQWMRKSRFFPALSDLLGILEPEPDWTALANEAWTLVCRAMSSAGAYRGVTFEDGGIGQCVRKTFGSWDRACRMERDTPQFAIARQTFLAIFKKVVTDTPDKDVTLYGEFRDQAPMLVPMMDGMPWTRRKPDTLPSPDKSAAVMAEVQRRTIEAKKAKAD